MLILDARPASIHRPPVLERIASARASGPLNLLSVLGRESSGITLPNENTIRKYMYVYVYLSIPRNLITP